MATERLGRLTPTTPPWERIELINRLASEVERLLAINVVAPLEMIPNAGSYSIRLNEGDNVQYEPVDLFVYDDNTTNSNTNNYALPKYPKIRLNAVTVPIKISGFVNADGTAPRDGQTFLLENNGSSRVELPSQDSGSSSANQIATPTQRSVFLYPKQTVQVQYTAAPASGAVNKWYLDHLFFCPSGIRIVTTPTDTLLESDWGKLVSYQGTGDQTATCPVMPDGWHCGVENIGPDKLLQMTDASGQGFAMRWTEGLHLYSNGAAQLGSQNGLVNYIHKDVFTNYTLQANDKGRQIRCLSSTPITITVEARPTQAESCAVTGWKTTVENHGAGLVTIAPNNGASIDGVPTLSLYQHQSVDIDTDGANFGTARGKQISGIKHITDFFYFAVPSDYGLALQIDTAGQCTIYFPPGLPSDWFCYVYNNTQPIPGLPFASFGTVYIDPNGRGQAVEWKKSVRVQFDGTDNSQGLAGLTIHGVRTVDSTSRVELHAIQKNDEGRVIACNPSAGFPLSLLIDNTGAITTCVDAGWGTHVANYGSDLVAALPPPGCTIDLTYTYDPVSPIGIFPGEGLWFASDGSSNFTTQRGWWHLQILPVVGYSLLAGGPGTYTVPLSAYRKIIQLRDPGDITLIVPAMPTDWWCHVTKAYPGSTGKAVVNCLDALGNVATVVQVRYGCSTLIQSSGEAGVNGCPGQTLAGMLEFTGDQTISWTDQLVMMTNIGGAATWTLDDTTTLNAFFTACLRNAGTGPITVHSAIGKLINGKNADFVLPPCGTVWISCNSVAYRTTTAYVCTIPAQQTGGSFHIGSSNQGAPQNYTGSGDTAYLDPSALYPGFFGKLCTTQATGNLILDANSFAGTTVNGSSTVTIPKGTLAEVWSDGSTFTAGWL